MTSPEPPAVRYEFRYTTIETGEPTVFILNGMGISEEVAHGIRVGLDTVKSITDVVAAMITETVEKIPIPAEGQQP